MMAKLAVTRIIFVFIFSQLNLMECLWRRYSGTYDLVKYSSITQIQTVSKNRENNCVKDGYFYKCSTTVPNNVFLQNNRRLKNQVPLKINFDEHTKQIDIAAKFTRKYYIGNFLLSFKDARNISAVSIQILHHSKTKYTLNYAVSVILCDFFFSTGCTVRKNLDGGIITHLKKAIIGDKILITLFPPIVTDYEKKHYYSIGQLFIGGTCVCHSGRTSQCVSGRIDDTTSNDGTKEVLLCAADRWQLSFGYFFKRRKRREACVCNKDGTLYGLCKPFASLAQQCPCKPNFFGSSCDKCSEGYHSYPRCLSCDCNFIGAISSYCNVTTGQCSCEPRYVGLKCDQCAPGRYNFPFCDPCPCPIEKTNSSICHPVTGSCNCLDRYEGEKCTSCKKWFENYPICHRPGCKCSKEGAIDGTCDDQRNCFCKKNYAGKKCNYCKTGFGSYPNCTACDCNPTGSYDNTCDLISGQCFCRPSFTGKLCDQCTDTTVTFPNCNGNKQCVCNKDGTKYDAKRSGPCINKESCYCKRNVIGEDCSQCRDKYYKLSSLNENGCDACQCSKDGSLLSLSNCDQTTGQCSCKTTVTGRKCDTCQVGYYRMDRYNLFGCTACNCNVGGSVNPTCYNNGVCRCKANFEGILCDRLKDGPFYVPDFYHNLVEVETATVNMEDSKSVIYRYNNAEFVNFTGRGYVVFGADQTNIKLTVHVPKTRKYRVLIRYFLKEEQKSTLLVYLTSKNKEISYTGVIDFLSGFGPLETKPSYAALKGSDGGNEFVLTKGLWIMDMSSISPYLLVDHIVILPEEYYTANTLQPNDVTPCLAGQSSAAVCKMYKFISLEKFQMIQSESGTNSKGYGFDEIKKTRLFEDPDLLSQLPVLNKMAELSKDQIALTLDVSTTVTDEYNLVVTYFNPDTRTYRLDLYDKISGARGYIEAFPCLYQFLCRLVVLQSNGTPLKLKYEVNKTSEITFIGNIRGSLAIDYVALVPASNWSVDYIKPHELCYMKGKSCLQNVEYLTPQDSILVEPTSENPANPLTNAVYAVSEKAVFFTASLTKEAKYVLVYHYYQPNFPSFDMEVKILQGELKSSGVVTVQYCSANAGCRGVFINGVLQGDVTVTFEIPHGKELWVDSMFLVPASTYNEHMLLPKRTELTTKFKRSCIDDNDLPLIQPPDGFCMQALITLTSEFTNKTYQCNCNQRGSLSFECNKIGGQCQCRPGVVGKNCDKCQTGYFGFPFCKACRCFIGGSVGADCDRFGQCQCKEKYYGRRCDRCVKGHWGFPDCQECSCDRRGSFTLTCRGYDGQCSCLRNYGGRQCNRCQVGYFGFPYCRSCNCNSAGIIITADSPTGCFKHDPDRCDCKVNVKGNDCGVCKENYYGLSGRNPYGCSKCNCSKFGTISGSGSCNTATGQCMCQPNVDGLTCGRCKDGYYVLKEDKVFTCQPCLCSTGGSLHNVCDKQTGQCKCKARVAGLKCNHISSGDYFLPSIGQFVFTSQDIAPSATKEYLDNYDGAKVNESFASIQLKLDVRASDYNSDVDGFAGDDFSDFGGGGDIFNVFDKKVIVPHKRSYHMVIYYALTVKRSKIDFEFVSSKGQFLTIRHYLKANRLLKPTVDILKMDKSFMTVNLTEGVWSLQVIFHETILFNQLTLVPIEHFHDHKISRSIHNPCTIKDAKRYCSMYTYYDLTRANAISIEAESYAKDTFEYFDTFSYKGANINGAILLTKEKDFYFSTTVETYEKYYMIFQYLNLGQSSVTLSVKIRVGFTTEVGLVTLFPCSYAFGCRQVALLNNGHKASFKGGVGERYFKLKVIDGDKVYLDFVSLIPASKWSANLITPSFYCLRRTSRCIDGTFPSTKAMFKLEAESARDVSLFDSQPPNAQSSAVTVLLSRYQRNLRWISPLKSGSFIMIIHYYQSVHDSFFAKIIVTTYQRAVAGKVTFKYCPSKYGCRAAVTYLDEDSPQQFLLRGNILRATFSMLPVHQIWVDDLSFISLTDFEKNPNILDINPLDLSKRYLRKCVGRKDIYIEKSNKGFCRSSTFELTLALNKFPQPCKCNPQGTLQSVKCNPYDGQCACKIGFQSRDCSQCTSGYFPACKPKSNLYK